MVHGAGRKGADRCEGSSHLAVRLPICRPLFKQQLAKDFFNEECMIKKGKKTFHKAVLG